MAGFELQCPSCRQSLNLREDLLGKSVSCPVCKNLIQVSDVPGSQPPVVPDPITNYSTNLLPSEFETIFCANCGEKNGANNYQCTQCGFHLHDIRPPKYVAAHDESEVMRMILPVGRSLWAILSGYLGLISILLLPAPFALITGILAVRDIREHSNKHGMGRAVFGIVMGGLGTTVLVVLIIAIFTYQHPART